MGDVELVLIADEVLRRLGLEASLKLSDPGIMRAVLTKAGHDFGEQIQLYDRLLNGELSVLDELAERIPGVGGMLRALLTIEGEGQSYIENIGAGLSAAIPDLDKPLSEVASVSGVLSGLGRAHSIAPLLVRNFEYYTGPAFHFYVSEEEVATGGRYDGLIGLVGGAPTPASGLALDMETLLSRIGIEPADRLALAVRPEDGAEPSLTAAFALANALREAGLPFRLAGAGEAASVPEAVAAADSYTLRLNGSAPQSFRGADDVVRALSAADP
jgi:histidyl-tRNA synthetase